MRILQECHSEYQFDPHSGDEWYAPCKIVPLAPGNGGQLRQGDTVVRFEVLSEKRIKITAVQAGSDATIECGPDSLRNPAAIVGRILDFETEPDSRLELVSKLSLHSVALYDQEGEKFVPPVLPEGYRTIGGFVPSCMS